MSSKNEKGERGHQDCYPKTLLQMPHVPLPFHKTFKKLFRNELNGARALSELRISALLSPRTLSELFEPILAFKINFRYHNG